MNEILGKLHKAALITVTEVASEKEALLTADALLKGGVCAMEIAFRNPDTFEQSEKAISAVRKACPEMLIGGATILNPELASRAWNAGAQFLLTAGFNPSTVDYCVKNNITLIPGLCTPGEIERALEAGIETVKFFPANVMGGTAMLKALSGPYPNVRFVVSGGLNAANAADYLSLKNVSALSGSWVTPKQLIKSGDFEEIQKLAKEAAKIIAEFRSLAAENSNT